MPIGVWDILDTNQNINIDEIIFVGTVLQKQGLHKVIESLPSILIENKKRNLDHNWRREYALYKISDKFAKPAKACFVARIG